MPTGLAPNPAPKVNPKLPAFAAPPSLVSAPVASGSKNPYVAAPGTEEAPRAAARFARLAPLSQAGALRIPRVPPVKAVGRIEPAVSAANDWYGCSLRICSTPANDSC